jgi:DNA-binding NarL/FixJ family response regulator
MIPRIRIAVIDEQPLLRAGVEYVLSKEPEFEIVGSGSSHDDALRIVELVSPNLILMDVNIPGGGIAASLEIAKRNPKVRVLFLTASERHEDVTAALAAGVCAYMLKGISPTDLVSTLRVILAGETFIMPKLATRLLVASARMPAIAAQTPAADLLQQLTAREQQILKKVSLGLTNKEIAKLLAITEKTVKHYMSSILQKLCVRNRTEAVIALHGQQADKMSSDRASASR